MITFTKINIEGFTSISQFSMPLNAYPIIWVRGSNGCGKAQPLDEPVLTPDGWVNIGDLNVGDKVIDPVTGKSIEVIGIFDRGSLPTYKISFSDKTHTKCSGDHLWAVYKSGKTPHRLRVLDTQSLLEDYKIENKSKVGTYKYRYSIPLTKPIEYPKKDLPIHPYVLGFILGDGCISGNKSTVRVSTHERDWKEVVNRLRSYLPDPHMVHVGTKVRNNIRHFRIHGLRDSLRQLGLLGCKSSTKFIPEIYLKSSIGDRKLLLAGLLDTDGHSGSKKKSSKVSRYTSKSQILRDNVVDLVRSLGGISVKNESTRFKYGRYTASYTCSIRLNYIPFIRKYKVNEFGDFCRRNRMVNTIRDIKYLGEYPSRCIKVDSPDGLYITRDYIVTHNTSFFSALVWGLYGKSLKGISKVNTWDKLRPKDYSGTKVEIWFIKDNIAYKVIRCQKYIKEIDDGAKGRDRLLIYKDGNPLDLRGKFSIQEELNKILGMSYMLFTNSVLFGQGLKRLVQESNADKRAIFEEIFNLSFLNVARDIAKGRKDSMREGILDTEGDLNVLTDKLENYKELKRELKLREVREKEKNIKELNELEEQRLDYAKKLLEIQKTQKEEVMQSLPGTIQKIKKHISKYENIKKQNEEAVDIPLADLIEKVYKCLKQKEYAPALEYVTKLRDSFTTIVDATEKILQYRKRFEELHELEVKYKQLSTKNDWYTNKIAQIDQEINSLKNAKEEPQLSNDYREKISKLRKKIKPLKSKYESQLSKYKDYQWLLDDPLGNNGIKAFLFDSSIDLINSTLDKYAPILGFYIQFGVNLEATRKDFTTLISRGDTEVSYDELSGGEKQLVNIALAFAMNEVLTVSQGFNVTFLDEVFESLSPDNIEIVSQLIRELYKDKSLFIITHQDSLPMGNVKILQVSKIEDLSHYELL